MRLRFGVGYALLLASMKERPSKKFIYIPTLLLSFFFPGAGQFLQKRWGVGALFFLGFLVGFFWLMGLALGNIVDYYRLGFEFETYEPSPTNPAALFPPLILAIAVYLANLIDVFAAQHRRARAEREAAFVAEWKKTDSTCDPYRRRLPSPPGRAP